MKLSDVNYPIEMYSEAGEGRLISARFHKERMEIVQVTHGTVTVQIGTERIEASSGDIFCVPAGMVYLAASHAFTDGKVLSYAALQKSSIRNLWLAI